MGDEGVYSQNRIYVVRLKGGEEPRRLASSFFSAYYPIWSPDGRHLLFLGAESDRKPTGERYDWWVAPLDGSALAPGIREELGRMAFPDARQPSDWIGDSILFAGSTKSYASRTPVAQSSQLSIWRQRINPNPWRAKGKPEQLTAGTGIEVQPSIAGDKLALATTAENLEIWMLPVNSETGQVRRDSASHVVERFQSVSGRIARWQRACIYIGPAEK